MAHSISIASPANPPKCLSRPIITVDVTLVWDANVPPLSPNSTFRIKFRLVDDNEDDVVASKSVAVIFNVTLTASTTFSVPTDFEGITVLAILINTTPPPLSAEIAYDEDYSGLYSFKLNC